MGSREVVRWVTIVGPLSLVVLLAVACTAIQVREFTRESYSAPDHRAVEASRVFPDSPERIFALLIEHLERRGADLEPADPPFGRILAMIRWRSDEDRAAAVSLGALRQVVTRTERRYRSYSPLDARCDECVIRSGRIISQRTEIVEDRRIAVDPNRYRIDATLHANVSLVRSGTRVELRLELHATPDTPSGLTARSTGWLEREIFEVLESEAR